MEAKWPWPGKFAFHFHGVPEERGAMGYFNVTNPPANAIDGKDIAYYKINKHGRLAGEFDKDHTECDPNGTVTTSVVHPGSDNHEMKRGMGEHYQEQAFNATSSNTSKADEVFIVKGELHMAINRIRLIQL